MLDTVYLGVNNFVKVERQCSLTNKYTRGITGTSISIGQSSKIATWPPLQQEWPWPITIFGAIDTREMILIKYCLLL